MSGVPKDQENCNQADGLTIICVVSSEGAIKGTPISTSAYHHGA
jgi:hypothetical protein